jgi:ribosomal protein L23
MTFKQILQQRAKKSQSTKVIKKIPLYDVLLAPMITEKTHKQQESLNKYTFKVNSASNKNDVKEAFVALYKITPLKVNVVSVVFK